MNGIKLGRERMIIIDLLASMHFYLILWHGQSLSTIWWIGENRRFVSLSDVHFFLISCLKGSSAYLSIWRSTELWNLWHCFFTSVRSPIANHSLNHSKKIFFKKKYFNFFNSPLILSATFSNFFFAFSKIFSRFYFLISSKYFFLCFTIILDNNSRIVKFTLRN